MCTGPHSFLHVPGSCIWTLSSKLAQRSVHQHKIWWQISIWGGWNLRQRPDTPLCVSCCMPIIQPWLPVVKLTDKHMLVQFSTTARSLGLTINLTKTEVMCQLPPGTAPTLPSIAHDEWVLTDVQHFCYLGSTVSVDTKINREVERQIVVATAAFGQLRNKVWSQPGIHLSMKCKVYWVTILPCLLYSTETYIFHRHHVKQIQRVQMLHLWAILRIQCQDHVPNREVLCQVQWTSVKALLTQAQLRWLGHVVWMEDFHLLKILFYSRLKYGTHSEGRPNLCYKDCLKCILKAMQHWHRKVGGCVPWP